MIGGCSGIGLAVAGAALAEGAEVTIAGRDGDRLARAAEGLRAVRTARLVTGDTEGLAAFFAAVGATLPARRVGRPGDIANAAIFLMTTGFATGSVVRVDGGGVIA